MTVVVQRINQDTDSTIGALFIDGKLECWTIEDEVRTKKVYAETAIGDGTYKLKLRTHGGFHKRYTRKFGEAWHKGMIEICDVPKFSDVLIHIGNDDDDTAGCLLVGLEVNINTFERGMIKRSTPAYQRIYPKIRDALLSGEAVTLTILPDGRIKP